MIGITSALVAICLGGVPSDSPRESVPTTEAARPVRNKASVAKAASIPSRAREAELSKTIAKRKAFRQRYRGNANRQFAALGPMWAAMSDTMFMVTASGM
jgi:hypothetical protein